MKNGFARNLRPRRKAGVALVVILAMVVLLTVVVLLFFSRSVLSRQVSNTSANEAKADFLARSALEVVVGDLKQEIVKGSTVVTNGAYVTYTPTTNTMVVPQRSGIPTGSPWPIPNLIRRSVSSDPIALPGVGSRASAVSSTNASANGRYVTAARWNSHYLIPRYSAPTNSATIPASTPDASVNFVAPDWVLVSRTGPAVQTAIGSGATALNNPDPSNGNYVIGRYAFAIYSEGGLLDLNAAGYPSGLSAAQVGAKGTIALADLTRIPVVKSPAAASDYLTQTQVDQIVGWRNYYSAQPSGSFGSFVFSSTAASNWLANFVQSSTTGFLSVPPGTAPNGLTDQAFLSRQELIKLANSLGISPNALQYLGTFSRELNAPSWAPQANASPTLGSTGNDGVSNAGTTISNQYAYKDNADLTSTINRNLMNVRVAQPFVRLDGTTAVVGEPLIRNRFDLNKLAWITHDGLLPAGVTAADILSYFGLAWQKADPADVNKCWVYNHGGVGNGTRIMTLDEVAKAGREPDFFELLQAGILQGSLGLVSGDPSKATDPNNGGEYNRMTSISGKAGFIARGDGLTSPLQPVYAQEKYQIAQIGANIIDQADSDSYPTEISLNKQSFYGVESLPYLNAVGHTALRPPPGGAIAPNDYQAYVHQWVTFSLWNPHQNASIGNVGGPVDFRVFTNQGVEYPTVHNLGAGTSPPVRDFSLVTADNGEKGAWVGFNINDYNNKFSDPTTLDYDHSQASEAKGRVKTALGWSRAGIYLGYSYSPDIKDKVPLCATAPGAFNSVLYDAANVVFSQPLFLDLQYKDPNTGDWHTYQQINGLVFRDGRGDPYFEYDDPAWSSITVTIPSGGGRLSANQEGYAFAFLDPRAVRLNLPGRRSPYILNQNCYYSDAETGLDAGSHFKVPGSWKNYANNVIVASGSATYTDRDSVQRLGDAAGWLGADPQPNGAFSQRPLILNRPFRNVGELGYVFRDDPWKSLNFFSASVPGNSSSYSSADGALLDIFCVGATPVTKYPPPAIVAGKVDVNAASSPVLSAIVAGAIRDYTIVNPLQANTTISLADGQGIATDIASKAQANPFINLADVPGAFPQDVSTINTKYPGVAEQREAIIRGLTDSAGTRTWNLLIDVIAQTGKYGPAATGLDKFIVEGEKRYWLHVAIDRFTGQIVGQQLEPVSE